MSSGQSELPAWGDGDKIPKATEKDALDIRRKILGGGENALGIKKKAGQYEWCQPSSLDCQPKHTF